MFIRTRAAPLTGFPLGKLGPWFSLGKTFEGKNWIHQAALSANVPGTFPWIASGTNTFIIIPPGKATSLAPSGLSPALPVQRFFSCSPCAVHLHISFAHFSPGGLADVLCGIIWGRSKTSLEDRYANAKSPLNADCEVLGVKFVISWVSLFQSLLTRFEDQQSDWWSEIEWESTKDHGSRDGCATASQKREKGRNLAAATWVVEKKNCWIIGLLENVWSSGIIVLIFLFLPSAWLSIWTCVVARKSQISLELALNFFFCVTGLLQLVFTP